MKSIVIAVVAIFSINAASNQMPDYTRLNQNGLELSLGVSQDLKASSVFSAFKKLLKIAKEWYPTVKEGALKVLIGLEDVITPKNIEMAMNALQMIGAVENPDLIKHAISMGEAYQKIAAAARELKGDAKDEAEESANVTKKLFLQAATKALGNNEAKLEQLLELTSQEKL